MAAHQPFQEQRLRLSRREQRSAQGRSRPGTFGTGSASNKIDYILLSPALWAKVQDVDVERRGVWAPTSFPHFDTVTGPTDAASDHAALWVDLAL